ncbi:MAG TPA: hypothetical protein VK816_04660 [Jatrophihabitantaceae bacterium]|jgi:hypothetical protein|nr:hypothetical protein [Jatrophihabitantaceae bacterium]
MTSALIFLVLLALGGGGLVGGLLVVRGRDQRRRDARRVVVTVAFPRGLRFEAVLALGRAIVGLAPATAGLSGRDTVAVEIVGSHHAITFRLRLPAVASSYFVAQLRAAISGLAVTELDEFVPERWAHAIELRRRVSAADLDTSDPVGTGRTILAALTGLSRGESATWLIVVGGGISARPDTTTSLWTQLWRGVTETPTPRRDGGVVGLTMRLGASAGTEKRTGELVARLRRAAASISTPGARLVPRLLPGRIVRDRLSRAATPITAPAILARLEELAVLTGWPVGAQFVPGLTLGGSPQLPAAASVPRTGRSLGRSTASGRRVAMAKIGAREHSLIVGPTGVGKSWLSVRLFLGDVNGGDGGIYLDPKGGAGKAILERLSEEAIGRTVVVDPTDKARPVPLPLLAHEAGGIPELAADTLVELLRHRYRDLGPRSSDILSSSLYALARMPDATLMDLLPLWSDPRFRARVAGMVTDDPVLAGFFAWFDGLGVAERNFIIAAPLNKIRPLLQRPIVRNVLAAPRSTFTIAQAMRERLIVIIILPEGRLGSAATSLMGEVVQARVWAATQAWVGRSFFNVTIDEAPRFIDTGTDLGDVLARSREYGVGVTLIGQSLSQFPTALRDVALNSARTKIAFGTSSGDAKRMADEFGPGVEPDFFTGLARYEAIGQVSLGGTVSPPFTFRTDALPPKIAGRAQAARKASRERFGIPRAEIEASLKRATEGGNETPPIVGRRKT